ncbi:MAG: hypothetical protein V4736_10430, partial [Bdellovibrionota bacterium]
ESMDRIQQGLLKIPWMYGSFREFQRDFLNETDFSRESIWEKGNNGVVIVDKPELLAVLLPPNCQEFHQA